MEAWPRCRAFVAAVQEKGVGAFDLYPGGRVRDSREGNAAAPAGRASALVLDARPLKLTRGFRKVELESSDGFSIQLSFIGKSLFWLRATEWSSVMKMLGYALTSVAVLAAAPTTVSAADLYDYPPPRTAYAPPPPPPPPPAYYYAPYPRPYPYYAGYPYWGPRWGYWHRPYWRAGYWGHRWGRRW